MPLTVNGLGCRARGLAAGQRDLVESVVVEGIKRSDRQLTAGFAVEFGVYSSKQADLSRADASAWRRLT